MEDTAYGIQDRFNRLRYRHAAPVTYWSAPTETSPRSASLAASTQTVSAALPGEVVVAHSGQDTVSSEESLAPPPSFAPPFATVAASGDGFWAPVRDPRASGELAGMYKTMVHPDPRRSFAGVAIVALELRRFSFHSVPGSADPPLPPWVHEKKPAIVPADQHSQLIAAFNGGFQAIHGHWGFMVNSVTYLAARPQGCTIVGYRDDTLRVGTWKDLAATENDMRFYRQTPPCLVQDGKIHPGSQVEENTNWGASVDGETLIRRSAFGIDHDGRYALYGIGDSLSAGTMARAMKDAGASHVAQLDVNGSYPRFFLYKDTDSGPPEVAESLIPTFGWKRDEYVGHRAWRDFFYVTRK